MRVRVDFTDVPRCPACGDRGYIDRFSPVLGHDSEDCPECARDAPERAKRAPRRARRDVAALRQIRARRALSAPDRPPRGALYVVPGHERDPYVVHRVNRRVLVLRSASGGYLVLDGDHRPVDAWWRYPESG